MVKSTFQLQNIGDKTTNGTKLILLIFHSTAKSFYNIMNFKFTYFYLVKISEIHYSIYIILYFRYLCVIFCVIFFLKKVVVNSDYENLISPRLEKSSTS